MRDSSYPSFDRAGPKSRVQEFPTVARASLRQVHPDVHVVEPRAKRVTGVEIVDDAADGAPDPATIETGEGADGSLNVLVGKGKPKAPVRKRAAFDANLAENISQDALDAIGQHLLDGITADLQSRKDWEDTANQAAKYLGITLADPASTVGPDGTVCQSISTAMLEAAIKLWGVARGELLPASGPVKVRRDKTPNILNQQPQAPQPPQLPQPSPGGIAAPQTPLPVIDRAALADALEMDMNHFLTVTDREYYPDFSKMLINRAIIGNAFRKVYRCPLRRRPVSVWVRAQDMIISNDCSHLSGAGRVTERVRIRQSTMRRLQVIGHYLDIPLVMPTGQATETEIAVGETEGVAPVPELPEDTEHLVYECYCELGSTARSSLIGDLSELDRDETGGRPGYPLPYRVSIDVDSQAVLEIRRNWKAGDADHRARARYVKYGFIPGLGFWDIGLIHIVGNPTQAATMIQRAMVDAGLYANFPGGMFLKGAGGRQTDTVMRPSPGEWKPIDGGGASKIQDVFMAMPYKEPSAQTMALGAKLEGDARRLAGIIELPIGEGRTANIPVGTVMAYMESVSQVPGAVHKDDHIAQQQEYELLRELFAEEPAALIAGNRSPARQWATAEEVMDPDLVPAADPNTPSQLHRLLKMQGLVAVGGMQQFAGIADNRAIYKRVVTYLAEDDPDQYVLPPQTPQPPPPDPKVQAAEINAQSKQAEGAVKLQTEQVKAQAKTAELAEEAQQRDLDRQSEERRAILEHAGKVSGQRADLIHDAMQNAADRAQSHAQHSDTHTLETAKFVAPFLAPPDDGQTQEGE